MGHGNGRLNRTLGIILLFKGDTKYHLQAVIPVFFNNPDMVKRFKGHGFLKIIDELNNPSRFNRSIQFIQSRQIEKKQRGVAHRTTQIDQIGIE